jgi:tRNA 5-methylaminomethyl-2-thiouridine biosynthesis bifunctional protein
LRELVGHLTAAWPPLTPNLHRLEFDAARVQLTLVLGDATVWLPELVSEVDAFFLDGFAPSKNPEMWQPPLLKALARLAVPGATLATWTAARDVRDGLVAAGFEVRGAAGSGGKRDITLATFAPRFRPRRAPVQNRASADAPRRAVIVGAGLAGCAAASALAAQGWSSCVIDRHGEPAQEASGNPAGLFHGIFNRQDGAHARFNRAAALHIQRVVQKVVAEHGVAASTEGLLRLETGPLDAPAMRKHILQLGLPPDYVQALDAEQASERCGIRLQLPAWFYPGGGWVDPGALARALLAGAGSESTFRGGIEVHALVRTPAGWELRDANGRLIEATQTVVLANAFDALRLLGEPAWSVQKVRGQLSLWRADGTLPLPTLPVTGAGYLLPLIGTDAAFGATSQRGDDDAAVRSSDHLHNLTQLERLVGRPVAHIRPDALRGRTAWRMVARDRLPIIGAVPDMLALNTAEAGKSSFTRPAQVPRLPGLFVFTALASRGITWSALGAQALACSISGAPQVLESSLLDAIDPARFVTRAFRRARQAC